MTRGLPEQTENTRKTSQ